ncbi:MAG TPA: class III extradiol ring-cleavage dioxygenase [Enhygromyxa sp.]|nr:class III extradiol ring-cleavage dioxygenase [Enhygromyxa sp.]
MTSDRRQPVVYIPHGGGPWPFVDLPMSDRRELAELAEYLRALITSSAPRPTALLVISAHWEQPIATVMTAERPPMLYDYYGFPPESYTITWPAPGDPRLAARVRELLGAAGFETATDHQRGFDHGTFIPLELAVPDADIPTIQLSLLRNLDPTQHLALGRALAPLRDEGVLIIGSGMSYHDLRGFFSDRGREASPGWHGSTDGRGAAGGGGGDALNKVSESFDAWLREAATAEPQRRDPLLERWQTAPDARRAHPREEHLLPLMVIAGAAGQDRGVLEFNGTFGGARILGFRYG